MKEKRVIFNMPIKKYADMRVRLRHDGLKQYQLFNWLIDKYLSGDDVLVDKVRELKYMIAKQGKLKIEKTDSLLRAGKDLESMFGLSDKEVNDIYDILEKDLPEV